MKDFLVRRSTKTSCSDMSASRQTTAATLRPGAGVFKPTAMSGAPRIEAGVGDLEPRCLGADEDVLGRLDAGSIHERSQCEVHVGALPHQGVEERATDGTAR